MQIIKTARGRITTYHGENAGRSRPHVGIDIGHGNETADDLRMGAPAAGRVIAAGWDGTYGNRVIIEHPDGSRSLIAHMATLLVEAGYLVSQGDQIGVMGRTGGPWGSVAGWFVHGHQEYHVGGIAVDPTAYMAGGSAATTPLEEDDMFTDDDRKKLNAVYDGLFMETPTTRGTPSGLLNTVGRIYDGLFKTTPVSERTTGEAELPGGVLRSLSRLLNTTR